MKRIFFFAFLTIASTTLLWTNAGAQDKTHQSNDDDESYFDDFADNPGLWSAVVRDDKVHIQFGGRHWNSGASFALSELGPLPTDKQGSFTVKRDVGTVTFNGVFEGKRGHGTYSFEQDPGFRSYLAQEGFSTISDELMIHLYFTNINKAYFGYMKENGYTGITMNELKHLAEENMNQVVMTSYFELFRKENYGKVSLDKVVELREHGVSPAFIARFHAMGYSDISLDKAVTLVDHGVSPEFVEDMKKIGQRNITLDEAIELVDHGVSAGFVKGFQELGFKDISLDQAVRLVDHGVSADFIKRMQDKGLKNMTLDEYIRLRDGGM